VKPDKSQSSSRKYRVDGDLHLVHQVNDEDGNPVATVTGPLKVEFRLEDLGQLAAGACIMALPVVLTEEVWDLGGELSLLRTFMILAFSLFILSGFIWSLFYGRHISEYRAHFFRRVVSAYTITFCIALFLLFLFGKAPLDDLQLTFTRTIIVAFPASFAATAVDFIK